MGELNLKEQSWLTKPKHLVHQKCGETTNCTPTSIQGNLHKTLSFWPQVASLCPDLQSRKASAWKFCTPMPSAAHKLPKIRVMQRPAPQPTHLIPPKNQHRAKKAVKTAVSTLFLQGRNSQVKTSTVHHKFMWITKWSRSGEISI